MNATIHRQLAARKQRITRRIARISLVSNSHQPMMTASNIHYEISDRTRAISAGGIGAIHLMAQKLGPRPGSQRQPPSPQTPSALLRE